MAVSETEEAERAFSAWRDRLGDKGAWCSWCPPDMDVVLDGCYTPDELRELAEILGGYARRREATALPEPPEGDGGGGSG